jgi:hypothetical protein
MASTSYTIKDGVKLVDLLGIVRKLQNTKRTSVAHLAYDLWSSGEGVEPPDRRHPILSHYLAMRGLGPNF